MHRHRKEISIKPGLYDACRSGSRHKSTMEPLLTERTPYQRLNLFPIANQSLPFWKMYKTVQKMLWFTEEIDLVQDVIDFEAMLPSEQRFLEMILAFFAQADNIVNENVITRLYDEVKDSSVRAFYGLQIAFENVHSETYNVILDTLVKSTSKKQELFRAIETIPSIRRKAEFALNYIDSDADFATRIASFACVEGIQFSSSFCAIFWLKKRGKLPGVTYSNELISRDEGLHCQFSVMVYNSLVTKLSIPALHSIIQTVVQIEMDFVDDALQCPLIGMNATDMKDYVMFVGDFVCGMFSIPPLYKVKNPFPFMETISLQGKTNFFEKRVSEYQKPSDRSIDDQSFCVPSF
jgi:ribonucleotide reductase beta subunit family protein with ferritin-like domain